MFDFIKLNSPIVELSFIELDVAWSGNVIDKENKSHSYERGETHVMEEGMNITMCKWNPSHF
jgi:hypothetical protein